MKSRYRYGVPNDLSGKSFVWFFFLNISLFVFLHFL